MKKRKMRRKGEPKNPLPPVIKTEQHRYTRLAPQYDYLKYFKTVRYYFRKKYGLTLHDLELLLFLYSEGLFTRTEFKEFTQMYSWDKYRFEKLRQQGWIHKWREHKGKQAALYEVSQKTRQVITSFYKKLAYEQPISEDKRRNPIFGTAANYTDKIYRRSIRRMNAEMRERPEEDDS